MKFDLVETKGYDPKDYYKSAMDLRYTDDQPRTPNIIIGGSRRDRGIFYQQEIMEIMQIYDRIKKEELYKLSNLDNLTS